MRKPVGIGQKLALLSFTIFVLLLLVLLGTRGTLGQSNFPASRIAQPVSEAKLVTLRGNTHPLARPRFDHGAVPASFPMEHMFLVLRRGPDQESALEALLARQQERNSPDFHRWLTPQEFGRQFGPSSQDIQTIIGWLSEHDFHVNSVSNGRTIIDFSGDAGLVASAFHTQIHHYIVPAINPFGAPATEDHYANASDPMIPAALAPVVAGITHLTDFFPKPQSRLAPRASVRAATTLPGPCGLAAGSCYWLGPADLATLYNFGPLWNAGIDGSGVKIAIANDSNINASDDAAFRSAFGLPPNPPNVIVVPGSSNPGVQPTGDEGEAILDVEWAGAVAKNATIDLVIASDSTGGVDAAAQYVVDSSVAPILSLSFGACEEQIGNSGNQLYYGLWQQAAAEGITVLVASGDEGSAGCEAPTGNPASNEPATTGLAVNGLASPPFDVAVGGTDFDDFTNQNSYWNSSNASGTQQSIRGYIPETAYNDSCTNADLAAAGYSSNAETNCNNTAQLGPYIVPFGGGGGPSNCAVSTTSNSVTTCQAGYSKPSWQAGPGVPGDGLRDTPDLSLFSGDTTFNGSSYIYCQADQMGSTPCPNSVLGIGGTSVATQVFAGMMALIDQMSGGAQGNANEIFYPLAAAQNASSCNSSTGPAAACVFYDVTAGTIAMPCAKADPDCTVNNASDTNGILYANGSPAYNSGAAYDLATGLGSVNACNLANSAWWIDGPPGASPEFTLASANCPAVLTVSSPGASGNMTISATPINGFSGNINLACAGLPSGASCSFSSPVSLSGNASTSAMVTVSTAAPSAAPPIANPSGRETPLAAIALIACLLLLCVFVSRRARARNRYGFLGAAAFLLILAGCGGGPSSSNKTGGTPAGATIVTINAADAATGKITYKMNFTLNVQ